MVINFTAVTRCMLTILLVSSSVWCDAQTDALKQHGALHIENGKMLDRHGLPPQLRGISLSWSVWGGKKYYNPDVVRWLKADFNINLIRVSMAVEPRGGYLQQPEVQEKMITSVVDAAIAAGIYVLIDWHDHHANVNLEASKAFFRKMSKRYAGVPNVIYEIWNEPEKIDWKIVKTYAVEVITEIRKNDPKNVIVVGSPRWDQDVDIAAKDPVTGFKNIAYSFHFYASDPNHQEKLMAKADAAIQAGLALFVTEWGVGEANGNGVFDLAKTTAWWNWMEKNKLSSANWNITDKKETTALLFPGARVKGNWTPEQLTPAGLYIRKQLRVFNK
ncbi:glycoside hydrolase family 5 protein [Pedobacter psychroterrae]|uniref:Glycoside hydrolase family 5 protein n=1 Tax=Pedobacter psychroterrae TaxID=2530453 RepID=A0A4R0ND81_9SPHI|nr:glycoside hydrolase family 5 protein [Pedobacter psychroterrae]TCC98208.1 glycoside hydrolase family 5 protein [Pedobacter psychroterrae]